MFDTKVDSILKKIEKNKALTNLDFYEYHSFSNRLNNGPERQYFLLSEESDKSNRRNLIIEVLKSINYKRKDNNWTSYTVAAFIQEVFDIHNLLDDKENHPEVDEVCKRYNVAKNKLSSMVSFFLTLKWNTYNLELYYTDYDCFAWKYRKEKTLQKALEENKLTDKEKRMLQDIQECNQKAIEQHLNRLIDFICYC